MDTSIPLQELRVKVAELCPDRIRCHNYVDASEIWEWSSDGKWWNECHDNDPLSDLNACHEFEKTLGDLATDYIAVLGWEVGDDRKSQAWNTRAMATMAGSSVEPTGGTSETLPHSPKEEISSSLSSFRAGEIAR